MTSHSDASTLAGRRVLLVGGRGFVGSHVARVLVGRGAGVHLFGPSMAEDRLPDLAGRIAETHGSLTDRTDIARAFAAAQPTDVVSCAGYGAGRLGLMRSGEADAEAAMAVNVVGHGTLLEAAREHGVGRVVWTSSTVVYGPASLYDGERVDEEAPRAPVTVYGLTKSLAEDVSAFHVRRGGLAVSALRLPLVLGPGLWYAGAAAALAAAFEAGRAGKAHRLAFHDEPIDLMHVADVTEAVAALLCQEPAVSGTFNLEGFTARASDLVRDLREAIPDLDITFADGGPPPLLFPLISGARLRASTGFAARYDRAAFVRAMLGGSEK